ncbi:MAG: hybrid sensor histidine kinase/response regulator [Myxococcales bacterium]|nr:hybrid sensor histidine kinase/response regulator [Myxococcales bacterium]
MTTNDSALPDVPYPILYVDDEEANRIVFEATVGRSFEVMLASSGAEALEVLRSSRVDVLITDYRMPNMTGVQLCEQVAAEFPDVQRLLITAYTNLDTVVDAINSGAVARYLQKPWSLDELRTTLREAQANARRARLARQLQATLLAKERMEGLAAMRGQVMHDLANGSNQVRMTCDGLEELAPELHAWLPEKAFRRFAQEVADLRVAVDFLTDLHTRVRGLNYQASSTPGVVALSDVLHSAVAVARASLPHRTTVEVVCDAQTAVICDRLELGRILVNLLTNAGHALGRQGVQGTISLSVSQQGRWVLVRVADDGPGVPQLIRHRIFEQDFTTKGKEGSGLGLSICRRLARDNGGDLELVAGDGGAVFCLTLPGAQQVAATAGG